MEINHIEKVYARWSGIYDNLWGRILHPGQKEAVSAMKFWPGCRVLEVGVGTGLSLSLYPRDCTIQGIDISESMLDKAREKCRKEKLEHVTLQKMDAGRLEFHNDSFDIVIASYVVSVVPNPEAVIREMQRVCKPGGQILLLNHFRRKSGFVRRVEESISPFVQKIGFRSDLSLDSLLEKSAVKPVQVKHVNMMNYWDLVVCVNEKNRKTEKSAG